MNPTEDPARSSLAHRLGPFRHRPYTVYWAGGLVSNLGSWLQTVAGSIYVYQLTGSALAVGFLNFAGYLPIFLFSIAGGVLSDRYDRRRMVIWTHLVSLVIASALAVLTFMGQAGELTLLIAFFAINTIYAIAKPSNVALLPGLVPRDEVTDAVGLNSLQFILGQIIGPLIAALVMATGGAAWAFTINALTFLGPIISMLYLQRHGLGAHVARADDAEGRSAPSIRLLDYLRAQPWVIALLAGIVATSAPLEFIRTLSPAIAVEGLGGPESAAGIIVAAQSVGSAFALLIFVPLRRRGWSQRMAAIGLALQSVGLVGTSIAPSLAIAVVAVSLVGFGFSLCFPVLTGALQLELPDGVRGRIMAVHQTAHLGNRPITAVIVGVLATAVGAQPAVAAGAVLAPVGIIASRRAWRLLASRRRESEADPRSSLAAPTAEAAGS